MIPGIVAGGADGGGGGVPEHVLPQIGMSFFEIDDIVTVEVLDQAPAFYELDYI